MLHKKTETGNEKSNQPKAIQTIMARPMRRKNGPKINPLKPEIADNCHEWSILIHSSYFNRVLEYTHP